MKNFDKRVNEIVKMLIVFGETVPMSGGIFSKGYWDAVMYIRLANRVLDPEFVKETIRTGEVLWCRG